MQLNSNSLHAKLYKYVYDGALPDNLCAYFWSLMFSPLWLVLTFPIHQIFRYFNQEAPILLKAILNAAVIAFLMFLTALLIILPIFHNDFIGIYAFSLIIGAVAITIGGVYMKDKTNFDSIITEKIKSTKENYCPVIDWDTKQKETNE